MHWCKEAGEGPIVKGNRRRAASNRSGPAIFKQQAVKLRNLSGKAGRDFFSNRCKTITLQTPLAAQQMVCLYERQTLRKSEDVLKKGKAGKKAALARMKTCLTACLKTNWIVKNGKISPLYPTKAVESGQIDEMCCGVGTSKKVS